MVELVDALKQEEDKLLAPVKRYSWLFFGVGISISLLAFGVAVVFFPSQLAKSGGSLVGVAVFLEAIGNWIRLKPGEVKAKRTSLALSMISAPPALLGTIIWTFG